MNTLRVVPPPSEYGVQRAQGTKVWIDDIQVENIVSIELRVEKDNVWRATIDCMVLLTTADAKREVCPHCRHELA